MVGAESEHDLQMQEDIEALNLQIDDPAEIALFLDLDGTLFDIAAAPRRGKPRRRWPQSWRRAFQEGRNAF